MNLGNSGDGFALPWRVEFSGGETIDIFDANGAKLASAYFRHDLKKWSLPECKLSPAEAKQIASVIDRLNEAFKN